MKNIITLSLHVLFIFHSHSQTNYYVDKVNGNDSNTGTSLSTAWKTIQKSCNSASPNSIVNIRGGVYYENISVNVSGNSTGIITFKNYLSENVTVDGTATSGFYLLRIADKSHLKFENLTFQNLLINNGDGVLVESVVGSCTNIELKNLTIRNINWNNNPLVIPTSGENTQGLVVKGRDGGITNLSIKNCKIYNNITGRSEALTVTGNVDGFLIENSEVYNNKNIGIDIAGNYGSSSNPLNDQPRNGIIRGNVTYRNVSAYAVSAGIYIDGARNITIEKNCSYENGLGIEVGAEENGNARFITVKNNLLYNNKNNGLSVGGYDESTTGEVLFSTFRNNTFFQNNTLRGDEGEITITKASNCVFEDNLFYTNDLNILITAAEITPQLNNLINYNCWMTPSGLSNNIIIYWGSETYTSFAAYVSARAQDENSVFGSMSVANANLLLSGLFFPPVCINAGNPQLEITLGETDYNGNPRISNSRIDMGAREFSTTLANENDTDKLVFNAYPNPFTSQITLTCKTGLQNGTFELYDLSGQLVSAMTKISGSDIQIPRGQLISGLYVYRITDGEKLIGSGKIIAK